jgi:beta-galactosidase
MQALPEGLRTRRRGDVTFAFNFGAERQRALAASNARFVLGEALLATGEVCAWVDAPSRAQLNA